MKKIILILMLVPFFALAQSDSVSIPAKRHMDRYTGGMNLVKWNLSGLVFNNYSFTYERGISNKISISLGYSTMPKGQLPFRQQLKDAINNNDINIDGFLLGGTAITPEVRFYMGKGRLHGFYIAPYARFSNFDLSVPVNYTYNNGTSNVSKTAVFSGNFTSTNGGLMFGMQYPLAKWLVLDFWLIGGHYGSSNGNLLATVSPPMSAQEQQGLQQALNNINVSPFTFKGTVTSSTTATIVTTGPWAGIRAMGLNLAVRF